MLQRPDIPEVPGSEPERHRQRGGQLGTVGISHEAQPQRQLLDVATSKCLPRTAPVGCERIKACSKHSSDFSRSLSTLDVSNNTIVDVGSAFVDMPELKYLDLSHNHLPVVKEGAFKALPELISLHLDHNSVTEIQAGAFQVCEHEYIEGPRVIRLCLQDLQSLEKLALGRNGVSKIERSSFVSLPSLSELWLDDNLITELEDRAFVDLYSLKELHLEHNLIEEINERAFVRVPSLR